MNRFPRATVTGTALVLAVVAFCPFSPGQEKSVRPDINKPFKNPNVKDFIGKFEGESREVFAKRKEIIAACKLKPGMVVADIGSGTGLFTRLLARAVGPKGRVYAVDIAPKFLAHVEKTCKDVGLTNVTTVVCTQTSANLPKNTLDLVFICDTYHHFEYPYRTLENIHSALKPGGKLILIDFKRIKGVTSAKMMAHVRAGQEVFTREVAESGFRQIGEEKFLKENYLVRFERVQRPRKEKK